MTDSSPNVDPQRNASPLSAAPASSSPVTGGPQRSGSTPSPSSSPKADDASRSGSKTTEILKAATAGLPSTSHGTSASSSPSSGGDRSPSQQPSQHGKDGARDGSSRGSSHRDEGTVNAVRSLISSFEQIMKEIPRGAAARFDGVTDELAKARKALDQGSHAPQANASGQHAGSPKPMAASPQGGHSQSSHSQSGHSPSSGSSSPSNGSGRDRTANLKDDTSSDKPSAPAAL